MAALHLARIDTAQPGIFDADVLIEETGADMSRT
ncbi:hypothetical protein J2X01_001267 [Arthrobacter ginsengisoli]|uniref:Uncharacterized protein n=1 Tax=Arthrobacter ginsengisoli TaxID=1356565 RepID=A0ABU1U9W1_9MICC|nr:hypothetical protein [Arthrobacter ginsengisoli]